MAEDIYDGPNGGCSGSYFPYSLYADACPTGRMMMYLYPSSKYWIELTARTEKLFAGNDSIVNTTTYTYNPSNLSLASVRRKLYNNDEYELTYFTYPPDYTTTNQTYPYQLVNKNILNVPIEIVKGIKRGNDTIITSAIVNKYDDYGNLIENLSPNLSEPLALGSFKFSNKSKYGVLSNSTADSAGYVLYPGYTSKATCLYDNGNPIYINEKDADKVVYLWGYRKQHPVAKIEDVTYDQVKTALGQTLIDRVANAATLSASDSTEINNLRTKLPVAQVTTYTYLPLVGMQTRIDPRGVKTSYFYDAFGRLQAVKDENGKTIETNEYHYKNQ
jgi:YD repeat-containing protein